MKKKICKKCKCNLNIDNFGNCKTNKDGLMKYCRKCWNSYKKQQWWKKHPLNLLKIQEREKLYNKGLQKCCKCHTIKKISEFSKHKNRKHKISSICKICFSSWLKIYKKTKKYKLYKYKYYKTHKKEILLKSKIYHKKNKEHLKICSRNWSLSANGIYHISQSQAKIRKIRFDISKEEFIIWYKNQVQICYYCKRTFAETIKDDYLIKKVRRLTIDRKDNHQGYNINNIVLSCRRCNNIKGNYFTESEMLKIGKIIRNK
jgi:5-methylcytosine-specific restriction endonuclease McrA